MAIKFFKLKLLLISIVLFLLACSGSNNNLQTENKIETRGGVILVTPTPFLGKTAVINSEYQPIKIADSLKSSVEQQDLPKIWLEFQNKNSEIQKVELNDTFKKKLAVAGRLLLNYQYIINNSEDPNERFDASYNQLQNAVWTRNDFREMEIDSPDGKRKLTEDEVSEIFDEQAGLINDRYFALDDHFKPKSAFFRFKKSVNEKLGYQIF